MCMPIESDEGRVCGEHGALWTKEDRCITELVLSDISVHRAWQFNRWGANRDVPDGTGPAVEWLKPVTGRDLPGLTATDIEALFREDWDFPKDGDPTTEAKAARKTTWLRLLREEVSEAFGESDPDRLYNELIQVAAVAGSWAEKIRERAL